jgi:hypothetical protein
VTRRRWRLKLAARFLVNLHSWVANTYSLDSHSIWIEMADRGDHGALTFHRSSSQDKLREVSTIWQHDGQTLKLSRNESHCHPGDGCRTLKNRKGHFTECFRNSPDVRRGNSELEE